MRSSRKRSNRLQTTTQEFEEKERQMKIVKSAAMVVISGLLMGASVSARAAMPVDNMASPSHASVIAVANDPLFATVSSLEPSPALQAARQEHNNCKASHMYGADDIVGDKQACIMGGYSISGGLVMATGAR
jgi:hypothetical protein